MAQKTAQQQLIQQDHTLGDLLLLVNDTAIARLIYAGAIPPSDNQYVM